MNLRQFLLCRSVLTGIKCAARFELLVDRIGSSVSNAKLSEVAEESKYSEEPEDKGNHHDGVQDTFDLALHWDVAVDQPQQQAYDGNCNDNVDEGHLAPCRMQVTKGTDVSWTDLAQEPRRR